MNVPTPTEREYEIGRAIDAIPYLTLDTYDLYRIAALIHSLDLGPKGKRTPND